MALISAPLGQPFLAEPDALVSFPIHRSAGKLANFRRTNAETALFCDNRRRWKNEFRARAGIQIDRRRFFDDLLRKQLEAEAREAEAESTCPVDCVREVRNYREFEKVLHDAETANELVVVDFYNSSCGACKYLLPQFVKLCKRGCGEECSVEDPVGVIFLKHNVRDEYDELTDLARFYSIRSVPMFSFFVDGSRIEQFPTRDKRRLEQTLCRFLGRYLD